MIIAIDGPAGAGKSTIARQVARALSILYIDTGAMYRAVTLKALESGIAIEDIPGVIKTARSAQIDLVNKPDGALTVLLDAKDVSSQIRQPQVSRYVSDVARIKEVREVMVKLQRELGERTDSVLDGRDIGTVVFPNADRKFYLDADFNERVQRRYAELKEAGSTITPEDVDKDLRNRDTIDSTREHSPLKRAEDAVYVDTTRMSINEVVQEVLKHIH
ncbi:MAG: (d)CMP kinase [Candidatus Omnitrophica bacterium]|nr:(d)CMP kinase [Candidatus Omnitrophota bacterium]